MYFRIDMCYIVLLHHAQIFNEEYAHALMVSEAYIVVAMQFHIVRFICFFRYRSVKILVCYCILLFPCFHEFMCTIAMLQRHTIIFIKIHKFKVHVFVFVL